MERGSEDLGSIDDSTIDEQCDFEYEWETPQNCPLLGGAGPHSTGFLC